MDEQKIIDKRLWLDDEIHELIGFVTDQLGLGMEGLRYTIEELTRIENVLKKDIERTNKKQN